MYHPRLKSLNSPLSPLLPMDQSSFTFNTKSPSVYNNNKNRRTFSPYSRDLNISTPTVSPIPQNILCLTPKPQKVPPNSPFLTVRHRSKSHEPHVAPASMCNKMVSSKSQNIFQWTEDVQSASFTELSMRKTNGKLNFPPRITLNDRKISIAAAVHNIENFENGLNIDTILKDIGLSCYSIIFFNEEIDLETFFELTDDDLKCIGIQCEEHRNKIINEIQCFNGMKN